MKPISLNVFEPGEFVPLAPPNKKELVRYINDTYSPSPQLETDNTNYSSMSKDNKYWVFSILPNRFANILNLLLRNHKNNLIWIRIPENYYSNPTETFGVRKDGKVDLRISCSNKSYLKLINHNDADDRTSKCLKKFIEKDDITYGLSARNQTHANQQHRDQDTLSEPSSATTSEVGILPKPDYGIDTIVKDGCFLERGKIEGLLARLREKKNLILQGAPGTGKTWLAKRLAYALMGEKAEDRVRAVQFHPNLSYEDFVRGWRPSGKGKLKLVDGVFMDAVKDARGEPGKVFAVVIEEINRGNPAQIFGELLTLIEADKRNPGDALELSYRRDDKKGVPERVHVPPNLYIVGTMNIADRSLAIVDFAFRRRFAFATLEPCFNDVWLNWNAERGVDPELAGKIKSGMETLNAKIAGDPALGKAFRVGHSFVTRTERLEDGGAPDWLRSVAETEIGPLLEEYWVDAPEKAKTALGRLLDGW